MFPDDETAEEWFIKARWPNGVFCPKCGSSNIQERPTRKPQPYRCRDCRKDFSVKTGSLMHNSPLGFQTWVIAIYLLTTSLKGVSSMKLHRDLGITQKSAWYLAHRIRENFKYHGDLLAGPIEADESLFGGLEGNKHSDKKLRAGRGAVGKVVVAAVKDRGTNKIVAQVVPGTDAETLQGFVKEYTEDGVTVYTDEHLAYRGLPNHEAVKHSVSEYVRDQAHTNGLESFWSLLKRGYHGTHHHMSPKHLGRYVNEFAGRYNDRPRDTLEQMRSIVQGMDGKRLRYRELIE
ncbi:MAG: IS1595 family transposase [Truepera sp.]|nr:IS1595 family transposase [Truepera sp.]